MKPLISIIVPVYNVENYVLKCLKSLSRQKYENIEIVIVDDGSTDKSGEICANFAKTERKARVFHKKNGGLSSARNYGLKKSRGEIVAFVDSDDFVKDNFVFDLYNAMEENKADIAVCGYNNDIPRQKVLSGNKATIRLLTEQENIDIVSWNKLYKKELFEKNDIFFPEGKKHEDTLTTYKLLSKAERVAYIDKSLYVYVEREGSITKSEKNEERLAMRERAASEAVDYFKKNLDLMQAAEVCLLWAKYNYLNCAIKGEIDAKYEKETIGWLKKNVGKYRNNKYLTLKLKFYNILSTKFDGELYKVLKRIF